MYFTKSTFDISFTNQIIFFRNNINFFTENIATTQKEKKLTIIIVKIEISKNQIISSKTNDFIEFITSSLSLLSINIIMNLNAMIIIKKRINVRVIMIVKKTFARNNTKKKKRKNFRSIVRKIQNTNQLS